MCVCVHVHLSLSLTLTLTLTFTLTVCAGVGLSASDFAKRLWGDVYFDDRTRRFVRTPTDSTSRRTFIRFVLEPLYKMYAHVLGSEGDALRAVLEPLGISLKPSEYRLNTRPLLRLVMQQFFGEAAATGLVTMVQDHLPSPLQAAATKVRTRIGTLGRRAAPLAYIRCTCLDGAHLHGPAGRAAGTKHGRVRSKRPARRARCQGAAQTHPCALASAGALALH
jgi:hypothetical protein